MEEFYLRLIEFQSSSLWTQKFIMLRKDLETNEKEILLDIMKKTLMIKLLQCGI